MFGLASGYYQNYLKSPEVHILLVGLDGAGKTTLLERLKVTDFFSLQPSITGRRMILVPKSETSKPQDGDSQSQFKLEEASSSIELGSNSRTSNGHRRRSMCPAPRKYLEKQAEGDSDVEFSISPTIKQVKGRWTNENRKINNNCSPLCNDVGKFVSDHDEHTNDADNVSKGCADKVEKEYIEYDLKSGKTMFPLHLIRPTVGMNLGKIEGAGAKVRIMDLGGTTTMRPLWERYYADIHGIAFVVDISSSSAISKLMESRAFYRCMRDDENLAGVPILIFGNKVDEKNFVGEYESIKNCMVIENDKSRHSGIIGGTSLLEITELFLSDPRGSTNSIESSTGMKEALAMFVGSAKTGEGIRTAFEWLIQEATVVERQR